jgi:hypothetical protein
MALARLDEPASRQLSGEGRLLFSASALHQASQNSPVLADLLLGRSGRSATDGSFNAGITLGSYT